MSAPVHAARALLAAAAGLALAAAMHAGPAPDAGARRLAPPPILGFGINAHHIGDLPLYLESVDRIAEIGANGLVVVTPFFQQRVDSSEIRLLEDRCPTAAQLTAILRRARALGLHTTLLPIVLIESPGEDDWRGVIRPRDPEAWWASYERFLDYFLEIAAAGGVDLFSVGSELNTTEDDVERWRALIERVRRRFDGRIAYTANWDRYGAVEFWSLVDVIGVSAYFELAPGPEAPVGRLARAWRAERKRLLRFARRHDRPLVLMEVGYPSLPWAAAHPWNYVAEPGQQADHEAQARCWRAFFMAWSDRLASATRDLLGIHCYHWDPYRAGGADDTGYGVLGKPAADIIRDAFARIRESAVRCPPDSATESRP